MVIYKQTLLGVSWAVAQPVFYMVVFSLVFGRVAGLPSHGVPYPLFSFAGLLPFQLFSVTLTHSTQSVVGSQNLLTKVYFPRLILPFAAIVPPIVDFCVASVVLVGLMAYYGFFPTWRAVCLPAFLLLAVTTSLGAGLWLSALNVRYRDVRLAVPFLAQIWLYVSPVAYSSEVIPDRFRTLYGLNPMASVIEGFRFGLLGVGEPSGLTLLASTAMALVLLVSGGIFFLRMERSFADVV